MKVVDKIALVLIVIGAINWGLVGIFQFNLVEAIFGNMTVITRIIYALVGRINFSRLKLEINLQKSITIKKIKNKIRNILL